MSELKAIVDGLRELTLPELEQLVATRMISIGGIDDFIALAESLNSAKNFSTFLTSLTSQQIETIAKISRDEPVDSTTLVPLEKMFLVFIENGKPKVFSNLLEQLRLAKAFTRSIPVVSEDLDPADQTNIDKQAGIKLFETIQALTEIIFDLEKTLVREVGKAAVGLPDVKRLASRLACTNETAKYYFQLASNLGLMAVTDSRHQITSRSVAWMTSNNEWRLEILRAHFQKLVGKELATRFESLAAGTNLPNWLSQELPLADSNPTSRIGQIMQLAALFGFTHESMTTSWFASIVGSDNSGAADLLAHLPVIQKRVLLQADGSIVAPGPLSTSMEIELRKFAGTDAIGIASTYRLTPLSVMHGLEVGGTIEEFKLLLAELSGSALPQAVDYLLNDIEKRFGKLIVTANDGPLRSRISSSDIPLLTEISRDTRLAPFAFQRLAPEALASRFEPSVIYYGLRECGFLAIRQDGYGETVSPNLVSEMSEVDSGVPNTDSKLYELHKREHELSKLGDSEVTARTLLLAIRNKAKVKVSVTSSSGTVQEFEVLPTGLNNGRLRGKDPKAHIERTLALATIISVELA